MDLIIEDEYFEEMGSYLQTEAAEIESNIREYLKILKAICADGIMEGETAKALKEFAEQVALLNGIEDCGTAAKTYCRNYIAQIDEADGDLY